MNRDEMIEKAARAIVVERCYDTPGAWDVYLSEGTREVYRDMARAALEAVGALAPLPVGTRKRSPGGAEFVLTADDDGIPWWCYREGGGYEIGGWLTDAEVADWEIIAEAPATNNNWVRKMLLAPARRSWIVERGSTS